MRIISGTSGGVPIQVPKNVTRPTTDRTRGAIFSILGERVPGARILDLFAGSGAYGLECLSRGAVHATFVEADRGAAEVIRANLAKTRLAGGEVFQQKAESLLPRLAADWAAQPQRRVQLCFADPPYKKLPQDPDFLAALLASPHLPSLLADNGVLILEKFYKSALPLLPDSPWRLEDERAYGDCSVCFLSLSRSH